MTMSRGAPARAAGAPADLVLTGGRVMTMDAVRRSAEAVAVRDGRIVAVGRSADVRPFIGSRTRVVQLARRTVLPSFQDAHVHPIMAVGLLQCPLYDLSPTTEAYVEAIAACATGHPDLDWVRGEGWYMAAFPGGTPRREQLDRAVPDRPAFFLNRDGHGAWVNSRALALAGVDRDTPDPVDGRIERDPDGTPVRHTPRRRDGAGRAAHPAPDAGGLLSASPGRRPISMPWASPPGRTPRSRQADLATYRLFAERGLLTARAIACQLWDRDRGDEQIDEMIEARRVSAIGRLRATTVKIFMDGVIENFTAALVQPYLRSDGRPTTNRGLCLVDPTALSGYVTRLDAAGFQAHFHALGDRAVREALDAIAAAQAANGPTDGRHHLAHLQLVDPADRPRFRELGAVAKIQPLWACRDDQVTVLTMPFIGLYRADAQYPFGSLQRAGARLAGGSDWQVSTPNVLEQAEVAVTRDRAAVRRTGGRSAQTKRSSWSTSWRRSRSARRTSTISTMRPARWRSASWPTWSSSIATSRTRSPLGWATRRCS